jgi:ATP-binding cassette subfamily F protein 3
MEAAYRNQRERIEQLEVFINRFRYQATKAKQVQSRIKELEKMERIELPEEEKTIHFTFPQPKPSGRLVAEFADVAKAYGEKKVFSDVRFTIERGDRIALVGVNGAGKSTLIKLLAGTEPLTQGEYSLGHNVQSDYFAQDQYKELDQDARMIDDIGRVSPSSRETDLRNLLGCFLFSGDEVFKRIGVLSGGERNRYALLRMLLHPANFLLLDEPTNHLDMSGYTGTVVFVSHDRYFIDKLATRVFEIGGGQVEVYPGNYEDFMWRKQGGAEKLQEQVSVSAKVSQPANGSHASSPVSLLPAVADKSKRLNPIKRKQLQERAQELEEEISGLEAAIAACENSLQNFVSAEETARLSRELEQNRAELQARTSEWEQVEQELSL